MTFAKARLPTLGAGLGYRSQLHDGIVSSAESIDWLELVADQFVPATGVRAGRLRQLTERFRCVPHSLELSVASVADPPERYVSSICELVALTEPPWFSDHLAFSRLPSVNLGSFVPPYRDQEAVARIARRVRQLQRRTGKTFLLENIASLIDVGGELDEPTFLRLIAQQADCGILLDLANLHSRCLHLGQQPASFIKRLDLDRVVQVHLAGGREVDGVLRDTHDQPVPEAVWDLLAEVASQTTINGVLLERDANFPAEFDALLVELDRARSTIATPVRPAGPPLAPAPSPAAQSVRIQARSQAELEHVLDDWQRHRRPVEADLVSDLFADAAAKRLELIDLLFPATLAVLAESGVRRDQLARQFFEGWPRSAALECELGFKPAQAAQFRGCATALAAELGCQELAVLACLEAELALASLAEPTPAEPTPAGQAPAGERCACELADQADLVLCGAASLVKVARLVALPFDAFIARQELLSGSDRDVGALRKLAASYPEPVRLALTGRVVRLGHSEFALIADPAGYQDGPGRWSGRSATVLRMAVDYGLVAVAHVGVDHLGRR